MTEGISSLLGDFLITDFGQRNKTVPLNDKF